MSEKQDELSRNIFLSEAVREKPISTIIEKIIKINEYDDEQEDSKKSYARKPIKIYVNTYGGSIYDKWALVDVMLMSKTPIHTIAMGKIMSAGISILLAGHRRFGNIHSTYMIHNGHGGVYGSPEDMIHEGEHFKNLMDMMSDFIGERCKFPKRELDRVYREKEDYYMFSDEALKYQLIHEIIGE